MIEVLFGFIIYKPKKLRFLANISKLRNHLHQKYLIPGILSRLFILLIHMSHNNISGNIQLFLSRLHTLFNDRHLKEIINNFIPQPFKLGFIKVVNSCIINIVLHQVIKTT